MVFDLDGNDVVINVRQKGEEKFKQIIVSDLMVDEKFDCIVIKLKTRSGEIKKYLLRKTKRDKLVLT